MTATYYVHIQMVQCYFTHLCWVLKCFVEHFLYVSCDCCLLLGVEWVCDLVGYRTTLWRGENIPCIARGLSGEDILGRFNMWKIMERGGEEEEEEEGRREGEEEEKEWRRGNGGGGG